MNEDPNEQLGKLIYSGYRIRCCTEDDIRDMAIISVDTLQKQGLIINDNSFDFQDTIIDSINTVLNRKVKEMGRVKAMAMENEEKFWTKAESLLGEHESYADYENDLYTNYQDLVEHLYWDDISDNLQDGWNDYHQKFAEMNRETINE